MQGRSAHGNVARSSVLTSQSTVDVNSPLKAQVICDMQGEQLSSG